MLTRPLKPQIHIWTSGSLQSFSEDPSSLDQNYEVRRSMWSSLCLPEYQTLTLWLVPALLSPLDISQNIPPLVQNLKS